MLVLLVVVFHASLVSPVSVVTFGSLRFSWSPVRLFYGCGSSFVAGVGSARTAGCIKYAFKKINTSYICVHYVALLSVLTVFRCIFDFLSASC